MAVGSAGEALIAMQKGAVTQAARLAAPQPALLLAPGETEELRVAAAAAADPHAAAGAGPGPGSEAAAAGTPLGTRGPGRPASAAPAAAGSGVAATRVARLSDTAGPRRTPPLPAGAAAAAAWEARQAGRQPQQDQNAPPPAPQPTRRVQKPSGGVSFPDLGPLDPPPVTGGGGPRQPPLTVAGPIPVTARVEAAQPLRLPGTGTTGASGAASGDSAAGAEDRAPGGGAEITAVLQASKATRSALRSLLSTLEGEPSIGHGGVSGAEGTGAAGGGGGGGAAGRRPPAARPPPA